MYTVRCKGCGLLLLENGKVLHGIYHTTGIPGKKQKKQEQDQIKKGNTATNYGYCDTCFTKETGEVFTIKGKVISESKDPKIQNLKKRINRLPGEYVMQEMNEMYKREKTE